MAEDDLKVKSANGTAVIFRKPSRGFRKVRRKPSKDHEESSDEGDCVVGELKKRRRVGAISASSRSYAKSDECSRNLGIVYGNNIGVGLGEQDDSDFSDQEERKANPQVSSEPLSGTEAEIATKIYKGLKNYSDPLVQKTRESRVKIGPQRTSSNFRVSCRFDYQPDVCKDYKETGYCGYGDSCVFLHDRGDYKTGWQLEKEWEMQQKKAQDDLESLFTEKEQVETKELPFACFICRKPFVNPVKTRCQHYFCERCALDWANKSRRCFSCGTLTMGVVIPTTEVGTIEENEVGTAEVKEVGIIEGNQAGVIQEKEALHSCDVPSTKGD